MPKCRRVLEPNDLCIVAWNDNLVIRAITTTWFGIAVRLFVAAF
jgi:hypothetical protein